MNLSLQQCLLTGSLGFGAASVVVFATVAFAESWMYQHLGVAMAYVVWTMLYVLGGAAIFNTLVAPPRRGVRFFLIFAFAFLGYAAGWVAAYFLLRGTAGEWLGSLAGSVLMGCILAAGFRVWRAAWFMAAVLFVANSLGYFIGSAINTALGGAAGMLMWGVIYGLSLGAGIGAVLYHAQHDGAATPMQ